MNVHETEKITALFKASGYEKVAAADLFDGAAKADVIVFNTCCVRNSAEQKIISHIGETKKLDRKIICVVGCLSQKDANVLKKKFPHLSVILGTHNTERIIDGINSYKKTGKTFIEVLDERDNQDDASMITDDLLEHLDKNTAYINITYGCENFCSYCIVPFVRGRLVCRDSQIIERELLAILNRALHLFWVAQDTVYHDRGNNKIQGKNFLHQNEKNETVIYLLGQNVNSYVCPKTGINFPTLLEKLCIIARETNNNNSHRQKGQNFKINFLSSHPKDFSLQLMETIAKNPEIDRNIHLPMQSGCDRILGEMKRGYTAAEYVGKVEQLRNLVPDVHITTDIICGFPTETDAEFLQTAEILKKLKFNAAFIFPYSRRSGTLADKMEGQVDQKTKKTRTEELINLQRKISNATDTNV